MSDRYATDTETRTTPNPHDVAMAVLRTEVYAEAVDWLRETSPDLYRNDRGFRIAVDRLVERAEHTADAPSAGMLDHASAAYARFFADRLVATGYAGAAQLLRSVADDFDGGTDV